MSKITLKEARRKLRNLQVGNFFEEILINNSTAKETLDNYCTLYDKIYEAEKYFGIDNTRHKVEKLKRIVNYYDPINSVFYYKEKIPQDIILANQNKCNELNKEVTDILNKIDELSEHIYIEDIK